MMTYRGHFTGTQNTESGHDDDFVVTGGPGVAILTICGATSEHKVDIMTTLRF